MCFKALDYGYRETSTNSGHFWAAVGRPQDWTEVRVLGGSIPQNNLRADTEIRTFGQN